MSKHTQVEEKDNSLKRKSTEYSSDKSPTNSSDQNKKLKIPIKLSIQPKPIDIQTKSNDVKREENNACLKSRSGMTTATISKDKKIAKAFGSESEDEEVKLNKNYLFQVRRVILFTQTEVIPFEMKIRMRNIGRNTPTSTGPNSYGKVGSLGFVDSRKILEKQMQDKAEEMLRIEEKTANK